MRHWWSKVSRKPSTMSRTWTLWVSGWHAVVGPVPSRWLSISSQSPGCFRLCRKQPSGRCLPDSRLWIRVPAHECIQESLRLMPRAPDRPNRMSRPTTLDRRQLARGLRQRCRAGDRRWRMPLRAVGNGRRRVQRILVNRSPGSRDGNHDRAPRQRSLFVHLHGKHVPQSARRGTFPQDAG